MKKIIKYVGKYPGRLILGITIKIIGTIMDLAIPYLLAHIIDNVIEKSIETGSYGQIWWFGGLMILFSIIGVVFNVIANRMASFITMKVTEELRHDLFAKVESLSSNQIDGLTMPSIISRLSTDTYNIHQMVGMMQRIGIRAPILLIGGIIVTFTMDARLTLVLLATLPLIAIVTIIVSKLGIPLFTKVQKAMDEMVRTIRENISGVRVIKALSKADYEQKRFERVNKEVMNYELKSGYTMTIINPFINIFLNIGFVIVIVLGAHLINGGISKVGKVISFTSYFTIILNAMMMVTRIFMIYSRSAASAERIKYIFDLPEDLVTVPFTKRIQEENHIVFDNVYFSYNKKEHNLENINFTLKKGESLGIIGSTGSGKTTIINLLMRFYDIDQGQIRINGQDVREYNPQVLKKMFGVAFQNDTIFLDTIKENIVFGREIISEDLEKAIKVSQASNFIQNQPNGIDTILSPKGSNISGGQKQRLLIARALVANPEILILDDSSSALDYKTDAALRKGINEYYSNTTTIVITQRISSIINCDYIMVIDEGKILGYGKHNELLSDIDVYQEIYNSQMGGGLNE